MWYIFSRVLEDLAIEEELVGIVREEIAKNISFHRKKRGLTRRTLAEKIDIIASAVVNWEIRKNSIDIDTLYELCRVLNVSMVDIFGKYANILDDMFSVGNARLISKILIDSA